MRKISIIFLIFLNIFLFYPLKILAIGQINYDKLYEDTPVLNYMYETGKDPEEINDYNKYLISPYVLIRLPLKLRNKNIILGEGYYLAKPEKKDGYRFVIFKQNGRVVGCVPVYQKKEVDPFVIFPEDVKPKRVWYVRPFYFIGGIISKPFKMLLKHRRPLAPPRAKIEFKIVGNGKYYDMYLYVENTLYKMLFKFE